MKLQQAIEGSLTAWAEAVNLAIALKDPAAKLATKTAATFSALGDIGISGATCAAASAKAAFDASASVNVSFKASASLNASASEPKN